MDGEDHFYLTLPSTASLDLFPNNKVSDFTTELTHSIQLQRENYEIGLCEVILDANIENVVQTQLCFTIYRSESEVRKRNSLNGPSELATISGKKYFQERFYIRKGYYKTVHDVFVYFNDQFASSSVCKDLLFKIHENPKVSSVLVTLTSIFGENVREEVIFKPSGILGDTQKVTSSYATLHDVLKYGLMSMKEYMAGEGGKEIRFIFDTSKLKVNPSMAFMYSDIVEHQFLGNTKASILRVVDLVPDKRLYSFTTIHYEHLSTSYLNSIRIYIRDVEGYPYPFTRGMLLCKVHIRRKL